MAQNNLREFVTIRDRYGPGQGHGQPQFIPLTESGPMSRDGESQFHRFWDAI